MLVLAFDTALAACSAAVYDSVQDRAWQRRALMTRGHGEALAPMVRDVMAEAGLGFAALDRIAVAIGPGTFTGLRIGLAMARGLGLALEIPIVGIDTLSAIALNAGTGPGPIAVVNEARQDDIHAGLFTPACEILFGPAVLPMTDFLSHLPPGPVRLLGTAADALIASADRPGLARLAGDLPDAANIAKAAVTRRPASSGLEPLYLRPADAKPQAGFLAVTIQDAGPVHAAILARLHQNCFDETWEGPVFARLLGRPGGCALLALRAEQPLGFVLARTAADEAEILAIGTLPHARRQGIAQALVSALMRRLAGTASALFIEVARGNGAARGLYDGLGFAPVGERKAYYRRGAGTPEDALIMRRSLKP